MIDNRAEFCWSFVRAVSGETGICVPMGILPVVEVIHTTSDTAALIACQSRAAPITYGLHPIQPELQIDKI